MAKILHSHQGTQRLVKGTRLERGLPDTRVEAGQVDLFKQQKFKNNPLDHR